MNEPAPPVSAAMIAAGKRAYHDHYWPALGMTEHTWEAPGAALLAKIYRAMAAATATGETPR